MKKVLYILPNTKPICRNSLIFGDIKCRDFHISVLKGLIDFGMSVGSNTAEKLPLIFNKNQFNLIIK